ncbi:MAG: ATP-binding protein [Desulfatibacillaceae bacterium]
MTILLVDDEKVQIETLRRGLRSRGFSVLAANSAGEAMECLAEHGDSIELVLTDYMMVGDSGLDLLRHIRERHGSLPVVMMTAYGEKRVIIDALRNRCNGFIEKPFTLESLIEEITRARVETYQNASSDQLLKMLPQIIHQVNNPLNSIMASAYLAMNRPYSAESFERYMENIIEGIKNIKEINGQISQLGKSADMAREDVRIGDVVEKCVRMFSELLTLKEVYYVFEGDEHMDTMVTGSAFDLEQAVKNLILNAIDAMDGRDTKVLRVTLERGPETVTLSIADTGCGIDEDRRDKIFQQYFTTKHHGTGLGLFVVKTIIDRHGGTISVDSALGSGTTFSVRLPAAAR